MACALPHNGTHSRAADTMGAGRSVAAEVTKGAKRIGTNLLLTGESLDQWRRLDQKVGRAAGSREEGSGGHLGGEGLGSRAGCTHTAHPGAPPSAPHTHLIRTSYARSQFKALPSRRYLPMPLNTAANASAVHACMNGARPRNGACGG